MFAAVEKEDKKLGRIRLQVIPDCFGDVLEQSVMDNVSPGTFVISDGWK